MNERELYHKLRGDPPAPPWLAFPGLEPADLAWRMGAGETHLYNLEIYFRYFSPEEWATYLSKYPEPPGWVGWYSGCGLKVEDSEFFELPEEPRTHTFLSGDAQKLVVVGRRDDNRFRVRTFVRSRDPGLIGNHWAEIGSPSLTDTEDTALKLVHALLESGREEL